MACYPVLSKPLTREIARQIRDTATSAPKGGLPGGRSEAACCSAPVHSDLDAEGTLSAAMLSNDDFIAMSRLPSLSKICA